MTPTKEEQMKDCLNRLKLTGLCQEVIADFKKGELYKTERLGILYYLNKRELEVVRNFEKEHNAVVYHTLHTNTEFGELLAILYVGQYKEEWQTDREDLKQGIAFSYVHNLTCPEFSEFGSIGFTPKYGGLIRTA